MKAEEKRLLHFLEGSDKNFIIPVYQRNYDRKKEHCKQLYDDLIDIVKSDYRTHFLGTIVAYNEDGYGKELLIIDGQQRLTSISILLLAIYKSIEIEKDIITNVNKAKIYDEFLINKYSTDQTKKIRLKPIKDDRSAFEGLFNDDIIDYSNITTNYHYFLERIAEKELSLDELFKSIEQLVIVEILLRKGEDDPQLIFESLNSTGLDLSEADKVRNFILMRLDNQQQEELFLKYWSKIEKNTRYNVSDFIRHYLTLKERKIPNLKKIYIDFKHYVIDNFHNNSEGILADLLKYSYYYGEIIHPSHIDVKIKEYLLYINNLDVVVIYPLLLELFDDLNEKIITKFEFVRILSLLESFVFRRFICDVPTNALNKLIMLLGKEIKNTPDYKDHYFEIFKYILLSKTGSQRFPNQEEFKKCLLTKDIYNTQSKNKLHLLSRLENFDNVESSINILLDEGKLSVEHIMPQTLTPEREKMLGDNYEDVYMTYLHTLGNITLTGYNSKYSNRPFSEKKTISNGFNDSTLFLNKYLQSCTQRTLNEILARANILQERAIQIWLFPDSTYRPIKDTARIFTLDDGNHQSFTGMEVESFIFNEKEYKVDSRASLYEIVIKILFDIDPTLFYSFPGDERFGYVFFTQNREGYTCRKINDRLYLHVGTNTDRKINNLISIFDKMGLDTNELQFYIK